MNQHGKSDNIREHEESDDISKNSAIEATKRENDAKCDNSVEFVPPILKLDIDCFFKIFDWFSLKDLIAVGQTCKRLQQVAGEFFQLNYAALNGRGGDNGISMSSHPVHVFGQYIQKISISGDRLNAYRYLATNRITSIKQIRVYGILPEGSFALIKDILKGIEVLEMNECFIKEEFYQHYLRYCPNVKTLSVSRSSYNRERSVIIGTDNSWLMRAYPMLENFELADLNAVQSNELCQFFDLNTNIRTFSTDSRSLWENRVAFLSMNVQLDKFAVNMCQSRIIGENNEPISIKDSVHNVLVQLHNRGFYKRLHLHLFFVNQHDLDDMLSLSALELLGGDIFHVNKSLVDLTALAICFADEFMDMDSLPSKLLNLERLFFSEISYKRILPFILQSGKLKIIKIKRLKNVLAIRGLSLLNAQREKLAGACKVTIYVDETVYLATKHANHTNKFSLIELKRYGTSEWVELSSRAKYFKSYM